MWGKRRKADEKRNLQKSLTPTASSNGIRYVSCVAHITGKRQRDQKPDYIITSRSEFEKGVKKRSTPLEFVHLQKKRTIGERRWP